jgi:hypothetical protein
MKITINAPGRPDNDYTISYDGNKMLRNPQSFMFPLQWDDEDIIKLIGESEYDKFQDGSKYEFDIPAWKVRIIECKHVPKNREQLLFSSQFQ